MAIEFVVEMLNLAVRLAASEAAVTTTAAGDDDDEDGVDFGRSRG